MQRAKNVEEFTFFSFLVIGSPVGAAFSILKAAASNGLYVSIGNHALVRIFENADESVRARDENQTSVQFYVV